VSVSGTVAGEYNIDLTNPDTGEIGVLSVYKTKKQAVKDNPKGTQILQFKEVKVNVTDTNRGL